jgi:hypothetical protein
LFKCLIKQNKGEKMSSRGYRPILEDSFIADEALCQYAVVVYSGSGAAGNEGHVKKPSASGDNLIAGVVQDDATVSGDVVRVMQIGKSYVIAAKAGNIGDMLHIADAVGRVSTPTAWASGDGVVGHYEEAPTASGDIVTAYINIREEKI